MKLQRIIAILLAGVLLLGLVMTAFAESSAEIKEQIEALEQEFSQSQAQLDAIESEMNANWNSIEEMAQYKNDLDEQIFLLYGQIENLNEQISGYTTLIAETQAQLDDAENRLAELNVKYRDRIRAMEEAGTLSYWSVIFKSSSFTDLIDRINLFQEIAEADQRMMEELEAVAAEVATAKEQLVIEKEGLEASRLELDAAQAEMADKGAKADAILAELYADHQSMEAAHAQHEEATNALIEEIAAAEMELTAALKAEEEERKRKEEEERKRKEEEERKKKEEEEQKRKEEEEQNRKEEEENNSSGNGSSGNASGGNESSGNESSGNESSGNESSGGETTESGWKIPCSYRYISSSYGYRASGWHNGVDFVAARGTPIYATRSGTVTTAKALKNSKGEYISYGNYVVVNHLDGYSSLYAHMDYYVVSAGDRVTQGQLIGYVGSTGNSSGNHLHFTVFYNGKTVNPMTVLP